MTQVDYNGLVQAFNKLFISYRKAHIEQQADGSYKHVIAKQLGNNHIIAHLKGDKTIGVFSGKEVTKFMCFDVDTGKQSKRVAQRDTRAIIHVLVNEFAVPYECIEVVDSGNKGYHILLFFDDVISVNYIRAFYREVLARAEYNSTEIELRPTATQGVKLPLGVHRKTGKRAHFVDERTPNFKQRPPNHVYDIKQLDTKAFIANNSLKDLYEVQQEELQIQLLAFLSEQEANTFVGLVETLELTEYQMTHALDDMVQMLETNTLKYPDTRNKYTFMLAIYLKHEDYTEQVTASTINSIMINSKRQYKGLVNSSITHIKRETAKIVKYVFSHNVVLKSGSRDIVLYRDEILDVLAHKNWTEMKLYLSMMIHAKRHQQVGADSFYMAYSVMTNYGNTTDRGRLRKHIKNLEIAERVEVVESGIIDPVRSEIEGEAFHKANVYRIKKSFNHNPDEKVIIKADVTSVDIFNVLRKAYADNVIAFADIKRNLSKNTFIKFKQSL